MFRRATVCNPLGVHPQAWRLYRVLVEDPAGATQAPTLHATALEYVGTAALVGFYMQLGKLPARRQRRR